MNFYVQQGGPWVYFIRESRDGLIKIGTAKDPVARLRELQCGSAASLELLHAVPGGCELERAYHKVFAGFRLRGEWFEPNLAVMLAACHPQLAYWRVNQHEGPWAWLKSLLEDLNDDVPHEQALRDYLLHELPALLQGEPAPTSA